MELLQLKYFMKAAELNNISQAARELNIVQSAVSRSIGRLEEDLGVQLFDRKGKKIVLNENGSLAYKRCQKILNDVDDLYHEFENTKDKTSEIKLKIETASALLPDLIFEFGRQYPNIEFILMQQGDKGDYDIRLYSLPGKAGSGIEEKHHEGVQVILEEEIKLLIPKDLVEEPCETLDLSVLESFPFVGLAKGIGLRDMIDTWLNPWRIRLNYVFETDNPSLMRQLLPQARGALFFPSLTWKSFDQGLYYLATVGNGEYWRTIVAEKKNNKKIVEEFIRFLTIKIHELESAKN